MKIHIMGCYAATPRTLTNPTSQIVEIKNHLFLVDCGEGTQMQLRKNKIKFSAINHIFISHLHGDHYFGLVGLISSFMLLNRTQDLHVYGPKGIKEIICLQLKYSKSWTNYKLFFHELEDNSSQIIFEDKKVIVRTIPLKHRIYANGFLFEEKLGERKLNIDQVKYYNIETCYYQNIKNGKNIVVNGVEIPNESLSFPPEKPKKYAFCSDTVYHPDIVPIIKDVDVLYHEATFLENESEKATRTMHTTAIQAANIAKMANAKKLILGHYSTRYTDINEFKTEAQTVFSDVELAEDGKLFDFSNNNLILQNHL